MNLLEMLMGSSQAKEGFKDFLNRFEEGPPWEGYGDQEVLERYGEVAHKVSPRIMSRQPVMPSDTSPRQIERSSASC